MLKPDASGANSYITYEVAIWTRGCQPTPANTKASNELSTFLVLEEAGRTISIFQVHTPYRALSYIPIEAS